MKSLVALYRNPTYSPAMHRRNDTAILDDTVAELEHRGWRVTRTGEGDVAAGRLPAAELYVNMCQGPAASERLLDLVPREALAVNPPESVLNCHRHRLVGHMAAAGLPFPRTLIVPTAEPQELLPLVHQLNGDGRPVWVKRGDVRRLHRRKSLERKTGMTDLDIQLQSQRIFDLEAQYLAPGTQSVALFSKLCMDRGEGAILWDVDGNRYVDLLAGVGVASLGYGHPRYVKAIQEQVAKLHVGSFTSAARAALVRLIAEVTPGDLNRTQLYSSGAEAVESAIR